MGILFNTAAPSVCFLRANFDLLIDVIVYFESISLLRFGLNAVLPRWDHTIFESGLFSKNGLKIIKLSN